MRTPGNVDWDFAAVEPEDCETPLVWYKCFQVTNYNLHYEGWPVAYADIFWCKLPGPFGQSPVPPWIFDTDWQLETNVELLPSEAFTPVDGSYEF
jgi:hypothetical protein